MEEKMLDGKVAIVTGSGSGLGKATAILFAEEGAKVVGADIWQEGGQETQEIIKKNGGDSIFLKIDVTNGHEVESLVSTAVKKYGRLDILVNSAGVHSFGKVSDMEETGWDRVMNTDLKGLFLCSKYAIKEMIKSGGGNIINLSSMAALSGFYGEAAYCAAHAGAVALTKVTAIEYAADNIRVNCLSPGNTETPMIKGIFSMDEDLSRALERTPMGRFGKPEEIAQPILFLVSNKASYITGANIVIDGGSTSSLPTGKIGWSRKQKK